MKRTFAFPMLFVALSILGYGQSAEARPVQDSEPENTGEAETLELDDGTIADLSKFRIERPVEELIVGQTRTEDENQAVTMPHERSVSEADLSKSIIELPVEALVPASSQDFADSTPESTANGQSTTNGEAENPKCTPGLVNWHPDFESACAASRQSGRPVMLFQLLGQLDERFT